MCYTLKTEASLWKALGSCDSSEDDYQDLMKVLEEIFRPFGTALLAIMEKKASHQIENPIRFLKECCSNTGVPINEIGKERTMQSWFEDNKRPKKGDASRKRMFALAFALKLSTSETIELFHKAYLDRAFNERNYKELIYHYCIQNNMSYEDAKGLISRVKLGSGSTSDAVMPTSQIAADMYILANQKELLRYIHAHEHNFTLNNHSAKEVARKQKAAALKCAQDEYDTSNSYEKNTTMDTQSDSFLYYFITGQSVNGEGRTGTVTIPIANSQLPVEIRNNFPQVKSLALKEKSKLPFEEIRKVIILLFSYEFWYRLQCGNKELKYNISDEELYDTYTMQLNAKLSDANLPPLYCGNPFDWLFIYCTMSKRQSIMPLDVFRGLLAYILEDDDEQEDDEQ